MPNDSEGPIVVFDSSVSAINLAFAQVLERLDMGRGLRGASQIYDRTSVGGPQTLDDAVRLMDLPTDALLPASLLAVQLLRPPDPDSAGVTLASGMYTPVLTNVANVAAATAYVCGYVRVGNLVLGAGRVDVDPTAGGVLTQLDLTLPIPSDLTATSELAGVAAGTNVAGECAGMLGNTVDNRARMQWTTADATNHQMVFLFVYRVQ